MHNQFNYLAIQSAWERGDPDALKHAVLRICDDAESYRPIASGGAKRILAVRGTQWAIAIPLESGLDDWQRMVKEEVDITRRLRRHDLLTSNYEYDTIQTKGYNIPALRMPNFSEMLKLGIQVRDRKNLCFGESMLFANIVAVEDASHWEKLFEGLESDLHSYFMSGLRLFETDSWNLAIQDTPATPEYKTNEPGELLSRKQKLRLFFYDLSSKNYHYTDSHYEFIDAHGNALDQNVREAVIFKLKSFVIPAVLASLTKKEKDNISKELEGVEDVSTEILALAKPALNKLLPKIVTRLTSKIVNSIEVLPIDQRRERFSAASEPGLRNSNELKYAIKHNQSFFFHLPVNRYTGDNLETRLLASQRTKTAMLHAEEMEREFRCGV
jgi:hypothetical protein